MKLVKLTSILLTLALVPNCLGRLVQHPLEDTSLDEDVATDSIKRLVGHVHNKQSFLDILYFLKINSYIIVFFTGYDRIGMC